MKAPFNFRTFLVSSVTAGFCSAMCSACLQPLAGVLGPWPRPVSPQGVTNHPSSCETEGSRSGTFGAKPRKVQGKLRMKLLNLVPYLITSQLLSPLWSSRKGGTVWSWQEQNQLLIISSHVVVHPPVPRLCAKGFSHIITYYHVFISSHFPTNAFPRNLKG